MMFAPLSLFASVILIMTDDRRIGQALMALFWAAVLFSAYVFYFYDIVGISSWINKPFTMHYMLSSATNETGLSLNYHMSDKFYGFSRTLKFIEEPAFAAMLAPLILDGFFQAARGGKCLSLLFYPASFLLVYTLLNTHRVLPFLPSSAG